jgi:hypothetical protein
LQGHEFVLRSLFEVPSQAVQLIEVLLVQLKQL